ncbi:glycosyltransferase family 2 protein [Sulfitobacter sp. MF3-043]|uniref:glycosyltransferase family 2 protein n=1 Tax=Sulfitobacter sediminivivens TaxID=3252902 RepID=UPI0036DE4F6E
MNPQCDPVHAKWAVSIVIVNWNTRNILRDCLDSIANQTTLPHEVIVVDNASTDGSTEMVRQEFPDVELIANTENRGFAAANNQGLKIATGDRLLLLNPDTIILDNAIDVMCAWLDAHPDVGCVGCQVFEDADTIQRTSFADPGPLNLALIEFGLYRMAPRNRLLGRPEYGDWDRNSERDVDVVSGMFMLVPRPVFEVVGLLDEAFFVYSEEADWCRRIRDAGWRCVFAPKARILHLEGGSKSTAQIKSRMYVQKQKSKTIYVRKHYGLTGEMATRAIFVSSALLRGLVFGVLGLWRSTPDRTARLRLAGAVIQYHLLGREPTT